MRLLVGARTLMIVVLLGIALTATGLKLCESLVDNGNSIFEIPMEHESVKHHVSEPSKIVKLHCNVMQNSFRNNRIMSISELRWEHKKCGYGLHLTNCGSSLDIPWTPVMCKNGSKFCDGHSLKLENPKTTDSGYYRCLYKNYLSKQFRPRRIFHVDIYDPEASFEMLDEPVQYDNRVVHVNDTVTFRCRARSLFPVDMIWAKLLLDERELKRTIHYDLSNYEFLKNDGSHYVGNDLYASKLTLKGLQISDSGKYYCIVISVNSAQIMKNKTMTLTILPRTANTSNSRKPSLCVQLMLVWINLLAICPIVKNCN